MTATLEANIARSLAAVEEKAWEPNREVTLECLRIVDMIHEEKPQCRLCGQVANRLDVFGLCSKVSESHRRHRGDFTPDQEGETVVKNLPPGAAPDTQPHERRSPCRPSCCKTPYMCARTRACRCHREEKR